MSFWMQTWLTTAHGRCFHQDRPPLPTWLRSLNMISLWNLSEDMTVTVASTLSMYCFLYHPPSYPSSQNKVGLWQIFFFFFCSWGFTRFLFDHSSLLYLLLLSHNVLCFSFKPVLLCMFKKKAHLESRRKIMNMMMDALLLKSLFLCF